jgi:hypothetical protein
VLFGSGSFCHSVVVETTSFPSFPPLPSFLEASLVSCLSLIRQFLAYFPLDPFTCHFNYLDRSTTKIITARDSVLEVSLQRPDQGLLAEQIMYLTEANDQQFLQPQI